MMATKIYGISDMLVMLEGDVAGKVWRSGHYVADQGILISCSDDTILEVKHGKDGKCVCEAKLLSKGALFARIEQYRDHKDDVNSDTAYFKDGLKKVMHLPEVGVRYYDHNRARTL